MLATEWSTSKTSCINKRNHDLNKTVTGGKNASGFYLNMDTNKKSYNK